MFTNCHTSKQTDEKNGLKPNCNKLELTAFLKLLGLELNEVQKFEYANCVNIVDTLISMEEVSWKGKVLYMRGEKIAIIEASWLNEEIVSRVVALSPLIQSDFGHVGNEFKAIQKFIDTSKINTLPDGYLGVINHVDSRITYLLDIEESDPLGYGINSISEIPLDLKVQAIICNL